MTSTAQLRPRARTIWVRSILLVLMTAAAQAAPLVLPEPGSGPQSLRLDHAPITFEFSEPRSAVQALNLETPNLTAPPRMGVDSLLSRMVSAGALSRARSEAARIVEQASSDARTTVEKARLDGEKAVMERARSFERLS